MKLMAKINHWWLCFLLSFLLAIIFTLVFCLLLLANQSPISPKQTSSSTAPPAVTTASDAGKQATIKQESALLSILTTGDVMLGRSVNYLGNKYQDYGWSLAKVSPFLQQFSYVVANLENPIIKDCPLTNEGMIFCSSEPSLPFERASIDMGNQSAYCLQQGAFPASRGPCYDVYPAFCKRAAKVFPNGRMGAHVGKRRLANLDGRCSRMTISLTISPAFPHRRILSSLPSCSRRLQ